MTVPLAWSLLSVAIALSLSACDTDDPSTPEVTNGPPEKIGDWTLVWYDEFDGERLDNSKWTYQTGDGCDVGLCGWGNNELQWYTVTNATVDGGLLTITAEEGPPGGPAYTSSRIRTKGKGDWKFGRFEIRARLPEGRGLWPAIWMMPTDEVYGGWAASGEIDIMELVGHEPSTAHGTLHYGGGFPANTSTGAQYSLTGSKFSDTFHAFRLEWEEGVIRWYVDDRLYATQTEWNTVSAPFPAPFDQRFHLIMNVAVGGNWPGDPDPSTTFPQTMEVDYVRVYQK